MEFNGKTVTALAEFAVRAEGGISQAEKTLMLALFKGAAYTADMSEKVAELEAMWSVSHRIICQLDGVTGSNKASYVVDGGKYTNTLTADAGYTLEGLRITIMMSDVDITSTAYKNGVITIESVTAPVAILALANEVPSYTITNNLTNVTTDNSATKVTEGDFYSANISWDAAYNLNTITVIMGGVDVTADVYGEGRILITQVTGDVVITALASEPQYIETLTIVDPSWDGLTVYSDDGTNIIYNQTYYTGKAVMSYCKTETDAGAVAEITNPTESDIAVTVYAGSAASAMDESRNTAYYGVSASQTIRPGQTITVPFTVKAGYYAFAICNNSSIEIAIQGVLDIHAPVNEYELATRRCDSTNWYTDGGETSAGTNYYVTHAYIAEQFAEDTELRITVVPKDNAAVTAFNIGCMTATSGNAIVHYAKTLAGRGRAGVVISANYTVKAGYYFTTGLGSVSHEIYIEKV